MNIKEKIFLYQLRHQPRHQAMFPDYQSVQSVLILYESDAMERNPYIRELSQRMTRSDKEVTMWGYCNKKEILSPILPTSRILGSKNLTLFGAPKKDIIKELQQHKYDMLLDLTQNPCLPLHYLAMYAKADFKAGRMIYTGIHDFLMETEPKDDPRYLAEQLLFYIQSIRTSDR